MHLPPAITSHATTVGDLTRIGASRFPDRTAVKLRDGGHRTYRELDERTTRLANALLAAGLEVGDRVAAYMDDCLEYVEVYLAAAKAGLVVAPINGRFVAAEAEHILSDSEARLLVWTPGLDEHVTRLGEALAGMVTVRVGGGGEVPRDHEFETLLTTAPDALLPNVTPDALYVLGYTSGTTGVPKGAMLTHASVLAAGRLNTNSLRFTGQTVHALTGSMSFVSVVPSHILAVLGAGGTVILMGKWDVPTLVEVIERERATFTYVPSPMLAEFARLAAARPQALSSLNAIVHSASRGNPEAVGAVLDAIGTSRYVEGWGMTEHSGCAVTATVPEDYTDSTSSRDMTRSVGRATIDAAVRLIDPQTGDSLSWDGVTVGELVISSPAVMAGYWRRPEATAEVLIEGWYRTGDLGTIDASGFVAIAERRTDLIVSGGMNVYPSEVEACILRLEGVREVAVVGVPHERWGQTACAVVVAEEGATVTQEDVASVCREHLASFKKPSHVVLVDELPKTTSLKVARGRLREQMIEFIGSTVSS